MGAEDRLVELGIALPTGSSPVANYLMSARSGNLLFLAGHGPYDLDGSIRTGKVGGDLNAGEGRDAARIVALNLLHTIRDDLGSLDRVTRVVKVLGMVNCAPGFNRTPEVIDGCSDVLVEVFGNEIGLHARSAVGMAELPFDIAVEIEMVVEFA
jgi:enamine deaminase RidA (YjgF/YER057c/UK114 family)